MRLDRQIAYWLCRHVMIGPLLYLTARPRVRGRPHIPHTGAVILAANHVAVADSFIVALVARRPVYFLAKAEYFTGSGPAGVLRRGFFRTLGQVPVDRSGGDAAQGSLRSASSILNRGDAWGIHPEGSRSVDGHLHRGHTGAVRVAAATGAPIIPIAVSHTDIRSLMNPLRRVDVVIGTPMTISDSATDPTTIRRETDTLMRRVAELSGQRYVDTYTRR